MRFTRLLITIAWVLAGSGLAVLTALDVRDAWLVPPTPPEITHDLIVKDAPDLAGRKTSFRILLFTDEFRWRLSSTNAIEDGSAHPQFTDEMKAVLNSAEEIICVGASSEEVPLGVPAAQGRAQEEWRAARRAEQIAKWVRAALSKPIPVRKLNAGHHEATGVSTDTSDQRRVVIILVLKHEDGANIDQALRAAMAGETARAPIFEQLLTNYSLAKGDKFTWVP